MDHGEEAPTMKDGILKWGSLEQQRSGGSKIELAVTVAPSPKPPPFQKALAASLFRRASAVFKPRFKQPRRAVLTSSALLLFKRTKASGGGGERLSSEAAWPTPEVVYPLAAVTDIAAPLRGLPRCFKVAWTAAAEPQKGPGQSSSSSSSGGGQSHGAVHAGWTVLRAADAEAAAAWARALRTAVAAANAAANAAASVTEDPAAADPAATAAADPAAAAAIELRTAGTQLGAPSPCPLSSSSSSSSSSSPSSPFASPSASPPPSSGVAAPLPSPLVLAALALAVAFAVLSAPPELPCSLCVRLGLGGCGALHGAWATLTCLLLTLSCLSLAVLGSRGQRASRLRGLLGAAGVIAKEEAGEEAALAVFPCRAPPPFPRPDAKAADAKAADAKAAVAREPGEAAAVTDDDAGEGGGGGGGGGSGGSGACFASPHEQSPCRQPCCPREEDTRPPPQRFLDVCGGNVEAAAVRWEATKRWRQAEGMDSILKTKPQPYFELIKKHYPHFWCGRARDGSLIYVERTGAIDTASLLAAGVTVPMLLEYYLFLAEYTWSVLCPDEAGPLRASVAVFDLKGFKLSSVVGENWSFLRAATKVMGEHYPGRSSAILVVNVPALFAYLWALVLPLLSEEHQRRVRFARPRDVAPCFAEVADTDQVPVEYGGSAFSPPFSSGAEAELGKGSTGHELERGYAEFVYALNARHGLSPPYDAMRRHENTPPPFTPAPAFGGGGDGSDGGSKAGACSR